MSIRTIKSLDRLVQSIEREVETTATLKAKVKELKAELATAKRELSLRPKGSLKPRTPRRTFKEMKKQVVLLAKALKPGVVYSMEKIEEIAAKEINNSPAQVRCLLSSRRMKRSPLKLHFIPMSRTGARYTWEVTRRKRI